MFNKFNQLIHMRTYQNLKQILIFIALVLGLSYLVFWGPIALLELKTANLVEGKVYNLPAFIFFLIGGFVPSIVGIFLTKIYDHNSGLKDLLKSAIDFKIGFQQFVIIVTYPIIIGVLQLIINRLSGGTFDYSQFLKQLPSILPLIILGPLSEEFGWRGFLQKRVNIEFSPVLGSFVIGITWSLWHLPLFYMPGTSQHDFNMPYIPFMISVVFSSFVYTFVYIKSQGSLFSALLLHWVSTYIMQVIGSQVTRSDAYNYLECLPALLIGTIFIFILNKQGTKNAK
ncbi:CPBP family intramembrane metalloprotease [bacterium]|nr:CPBP family intramembrane metalloprotease [bacterium]